ncbi:uncharacterized protein ACJ7VT_021831 [Polymixia lowei]
MVDMLLNGILEVNEKTQTLTSFVTIATITIERKPLLYIINLVLPITFLLVLDVASFFISEARGEKLGFKVTILLSISVLLLILQDMLPSTADRLPLIALHCIVIFMLTGLSLLETMLVSFLVDMDGCVANEVDTFNNCVCPDTQRDAETSESHGGQTVSEPVTDLNMTIERMENQQKNGLQGFRLQAPAPDDIIHFS